MRRVLANNEHVFRKPMLMLACGPGVFLLYKMPSGVSLLFGGGKRKVNFRTKNFDELHLPKKEWVHSPIPLVQDLGTLQHRKLLMAGRDEEGCTFLGGLYL